MVEPELRIVVFWSAVPNVWRCSPLVLRFRRNEFFDTPPPMVALILQTVEFGYETGFTYLSGFRPSTFATCVVISMHQMDKTGEFREK